MQPKRTASVQALEAARYALLRRLAPPIRHDMAAHLQPIGMLGEVLARRLAAETPETATVRDGVGRLTTLARGAVHASLDAVSWIAPDPERRVSLDEGIGEIVSLLRSHLGFRGIVLEPEPTDGIAGTVPHGSLRTVLPAAVLLLADDAGPPCSIALSVQDDGPRARVTLQLEPTEGEAGMDIEPPYRSLTQDEVALLSQAEGIGFEQEGDRVTLTVAVQR